MFDKIFIKNVNIIDGLGNEPFQGSVYVENKRICKIQLECYILATSLSLLFIWS